MLCWSAIGLRVVTTPAIAAPVQSRQGMVVSAHPLASEAGLMMLQQGGNAIDAAVATTLAISVVEPFSAGIGGGGFLLLYQSDRQSVQALDFRERAPLAATREMFVMPDNPRSSNATVKGHRAVAVPGTVAGLYDVHQRYGKLPWSKVVAPSIQLAEKGFQVSPRFVRAVERSRPSLNPAARDAFTRNGWPYRVGDTLVQPDLAKTMLIISQNPQDFYQGKIADRIAKDMAENGGLVSLKDLQAYRPIWREPLCGQFQKYQVCSMPPPSSGGVHLLQILNLFSKQDFKATGRWHPDMLHDLAEMMRIAYADRAEYLGDPDFVEVPVAAILSPAYAAYRRQEINPQQARRSQDLKVLDRSSLQRFTQQKESEDTSHLTVVDRDRNVVSLTFTVNRGFGSGVVVPGTGILLNDEMDDFSIAPGVPNSYGLVGGEANAIAPGKTPLSSMTPTIVTEQGQLRLAVGAPGGSTIITTVTQIVLNVLVFNMNAEAAVASPRLHHQWLPDQLMVEQNFDPAAIVGLRQKGHNIQQRGSWGNANLIQQTPEGMLEGAADPRGEGAVRGF